MPLPLHPSPIYAEGNPVRSVPHDILGDPLSP
jgi:hypothetical protein